MGILSCILLIDNCRFRIGHSTNILKCKNISIEILKDIGIVVPKIMETRFNAYMHTQAGNNNNMRNSVRYTVLLMEYTPSYIQLILVK